MGRPFLALESVRHLTFGLSTFFVPFLLAAVYRPILGLDFLSAHGLLVDPVGHQVLDLKTLKPLSKAKTAAGTLRFKFAAALCSIAPTVRSLLASFPAIVDDGKGKPSPKHKIRHTIETTGRPVFAKARHLGQDKLRQAETEFRELEAAGIICCSDSPWSSPLHMVRKKDRSWRPCGDYRRLNLATTHDRYSLTSILDLSNKLHGCKFFSCIDLVKGYHQIPMAAQDIAKTGIITVALMETFRYLELCTDFPALHGQPIQAPALCVLLPGRPLHRQPHAGGASRASPADLHYPSGEQPADQSSKVRVRRRRL
jgi:hypothetical protein